ncbi:hypothetical protein RF11_03243 [Thelohanellus kitauei]|uniref:Uncharacterized protein n=1 Tax=Thelohanellus kitauei TaxID=669202 RepID=A0A0C2MR73_THEKT|nr:hypothetical protein RF11_03243 [Thelohanellus kitauei]
MSQILKCRDATTNISLTLLGNFLENIAVKRSEIISRDNVASTLSIFKRDSFIEKKKTLKSCKLCFLKPKKIYGLGSMDGPIKDVFLLHNTASEIDDILSKHFSATTEHHDEPKYPSHLFVINHRLIEE